MHRPQLRWGSQRRPGRKVDSWRAATTSWSRIGNMNRWQPLTGLSDTISSQPVNRAAKSDLNFERTFRISGSPLHGASRDDVNSGFLERRADRPKSLALPDQCRHCGCLAQSRAAPVFAAAMIREPPYVGCVFFNTLL